MHDIDRIQRELEMEHEHEHEYEAEQEGEASLGALFGEAEYEGEQEQEQEQEHEAEQELEMELSQEAESPLSEAQEMELASELLEVSNEGELEYFFGKLFRSAARGVKNFARSRQGRVLGGMLKGMAKRALPVAGTAVGSYVGGPLGAKAGRWAGRKIAGLFELELEGLSNEDREFEVARQLVRLGAAAAHRAARAPRNMPPAAAARHAFKAAARTYAPGLVHGHRQCRTCGATRGGGRGRRHHRAGGDPMFGPRAGGTNGATEPGDGAAASGGRWFRRGQQIVLTGV
jgi:hypothetical protein